MDNDAVRFNARFGGVSREIYVPVHNVLAIYANENGQGMAFEVTAPAAEGLAPAASMTAAEPAQAGPALSSVPTGAAETAPADVSPNPDDNDEPPKKGGRPTLTRIK
jgi:stringent starvation protein B